MNSPGKKGRFGIVISGSIFLLVRNVYAVVQIIRFRGSINVAGMVENAIDLSDQI